VLEQRTRDLRDRRLRYVSLSTDKHVARKASDLLILEYLHRLGPQTTEALYQLLHPTYRNKRSLLYRLAALRNQDNSDYGGPVLSYPTQQRRGASLPDSNYMVYDLTARGQSVLKRAGLHHRYHPVTNGAEWRHDFMGATLASSILIGAQALPDQYAYIYGDEIIERIDGLRTFPVPPYRYTVKAGEERTRNDATLRPDGFIGIRYLPSRTERIFLVENDCNTEPYRSDNLERKTHMHSILSYFTLLSNTENRRKYFGEAKVGVLNLFSHPRAMRSAMALQSELLGDKCKFMLYQTWEAFGDFFRPPPPRIDLFTDPWERVGHERFFINTVDGMPPQGREY
jgi:Replication-relaxation